MNIAKNMEAIFVVAIALIGVTSFAQAAALVRTMPVAGPSAEVVEGKMQVVVVTAKRPKPAAPVVAK
jgi:hypothetical protein